MQKFVYTVYTLYLGDNKALHNNHYDTIFFILDAYIYLCTNPFVRPRSRTLIWIWSTHNIHLHTKKLIGHFNNAFCFIFY